MARRSDRGQYSAIAILVAGLVLAALSGTCTLLGSGDLFAPPLPHETQAASAYQRGWAVLFVYCGSLVFGTVLALTAVLWRELSGGAWRDSLDGWRLGVRRLFAAGFAIVVLTMIALGARGVSTAHGGGILFVLGVTGLPATLFGYAAYRAWGQAPRTPLKSVGSE